MDKWARLNPGEEVDVPADMTRLTLDTIALCGFGYRFNSFYRETPHPFVDGDGARPRGVAGPDASAADPDPAADPGAAAAGGGPGVHERPGRRAHRRAPRAGRRRATPPTCWAGCSPASTSRPASGCRTRTSGPSASPSSSPATRPPSGLLSFAIYYLLKNPDVAGAGPGRGRRGARRHRRSPTFEQVHRLHLRPADPRRDAAAVADRARLHPLPLPGHGDRRPVRDPGGHPDHRAEPGAAPAHRASGAPTPRSSTPTTSPPSGMADDPAERLQALRHRAAGLHRPPVRPAGGRCWCSACCCSGSSSSTTCDYQLHDQDHAHGQARRLLHPGPAAGRACASTAPIPAAGRPSGRRRRPGADAGAARRPARHAAVGAVRVEPRHRGGDRHPARPGGHRARLRRDPRRARRPRRRPARRTAPSLIVCSSYNGDAAGQRRGRSAGWIDRRRRRTRADGVAYTVFGCGNTEWAATYQAVPTLLDDAARARTAAAGSIPAARATPPATSTPPTATGTATCGPTWPTALDLPGRAWASPRPRPGRGCRSR